MFKDGQRPNWGGWWWQRDEEETRSGERKERREMRRDQEAMTGEQGGTEREDNVTTSQRGR
jgi:hypothetical protein